MSEYTILSVMASIIVVCLDLFVMKTKVTMQIAFWIFILAMYGFMLFVNGYLTWRPIVIYHDPFYLGIRLFTIPIEDFVYGFALMTLSVVCWEWLKTKRRAE